MLRFLIKTIGFVFLILILMMLGILGYVRDLNINDVPRNNVSNSSCFRAKIDHAVSQDYLKDCTFLISGSSMSLNNVSGLTIHNRMGSKVYNVSSFGTKPRQTIEMFNHEIFGEQIDYLMVAFNNCDFGDLNNITVDFNATDKFINGGILSRIWIFLKTFNLITFFSDLKDRTDFSGIVNNYKSLRFDNTGSVLLEREGFKVDSARWEEYYDTTGFRVFYNDILELDSICKEKSVGFYLVYLPFRRDLVTEEYKLQNNEIANALKSDLGQNFIDLSNLHIDTENYCDYAHMYKEGAEEITGIALDSIYSALVASCRRK